MPNQFTASLWGDEAFSAVLSQNTVPKILEIISRDTSPPLYNLTLHFWYQAFGSSELAIRALSFFYYCLAIFFVYKIGAVLWNRKTGLLAAGLTFLNPFFFIYAFEGRMYSILALGVAASMYFFLKRKWVFYVLATIGALYSHHFALFALFIQGVWFIYESLFGQKKVARKMFKSFLLVGLLYLPWLVPLYQQTKMVSGGFWLTKPDLTDLRNLLYKYLVEGIKKSQPALWLTLAVLLLKNWFKESKKNLFLLSWFLGPILLTWGLSQKFQSIFFDRYLLYCIPAAMILISSGRRKYSVLLLALIIGFFLWVDFNYFTHPNKRPFRELAQYVKQNKKEGDLLLNWNSKAHHLWESKYYQIPAPIYLPQGDLPYFAGTAQMTQDDLLREIPKGTKRIGVITSGDIAEIKLPYYTEKESQSFAELKLVWFQK